MTLRIEEALAKAKREGKKIKKKDLAIALFGQETSEGARNAKLTALLNGSRSRIAPEWVVTICTMLGCSADYLFGLKNN